MNQTLSNQDIVLPQGEKRIKQCFAGLKQANRAGLISFTMAYDPDYATSLDIIQSLPEAGVDILEIGMPFSDPMADGSAIQLAGGRALKQQATMEGILSLVRHFREKNQSTPVILMGYYNVILNYGEESFAQDAAKAGVDGLIIVDLPPEEDDGLFNATQQVGMSLIKLVTPTTDEQRLKKILPKASGFLYYVSIAGVTGTRSASDDSVKQAIDRIRLQTDLPIAVGFGIKTSEQVGQMGQLADAVVVGSALVQQIEQHPDNPAAAKDALLALAKNLSIR